MSRHKIEIVLLSNPFDGDSFGIESNGTLLFEFIFKNAPAPTGPNYVQIVPNNAAGTTSNLYGVFFQTYNRSGIYVQKLNGYVFTIEGEFAVKPTVSYDYAPSVQINITDVEEQIVLTSYNFQQNASSTCDLIDFTIYSNIPFDQLIEPINITLDPPVTSCQLIGYPRGSIIKCTVLANSSPANSSSINVTTPSYLNAGTIDISIVNNTVYVDVLNKTGLILEYSITGTIWQSENTFVGLGNGDYTMYVRDQFSCQVTEQFTIAEGDDGVIKIVDPYFFYSKANAIRFALRETIDDCGVLKNDSNTLSCEVFDNVKYKELQKYRSCDTINLQFKNNYSDLTVVTTDDNEIIPLQQKSTNMNNKIALDCNIVQYEPTLNGIYFIAGKTYDYDTLAETGEYQLNGQLPYWLAVGSIVTINNFNYTVLEIVFEENLQVDMAIIAATYSGGVYTMKAIYNIFDYEIYEVAIPLLNKGRFQISISYDGIERMLSEEIIVNDNVDKLVKIQYYMDYNTDMFYATGIQPMFRALLTKSIASVKGSKEKYETDTTVIQIDATNYEMNDFIFEPVTKEMARKMVLAFSSSNVNINGIDYVADEPASIEQLEDSNLYVVTVKMIDKNSGITRDYVGTSFIALPQLIKTENGYIKI